jgi:hypothetical protein
MNKEHFKYIKLILEGYTFSVSTRTHKYYLYNDSDDIFYINDISIVAKIITDYRIIFQRIEKNPLRSVYKKSTLLSEKDYKQLREEAPELYRNEKINKLLRNVII